MSDALLPCPFCGDRLGELWVDGEVVTHLGKPLMVHPYSGCVLEGEKFTARQFPAWNRRASAPSDALREALRRYQEALVMYDDKARDIQDHWGDPGGYTHNALLTAQLVHGDTVAEARAALASQDADSQSRAERATTPTEQEHEWVPAPNRSWDMCAKCGFIRRADGKNRPCRGPTPILPRETEQGAEKPE